MEERVYKIEVECYKRGECVTRAFYGSSEEEVVNAIKGECESNHYDAVCTKSMEMYYPYAYVADLLQSFGEKNDK